MTPRACLVPVLLGLLLAACAATPTPRHGADGDLLGLPTVKNLAGVPSTMPAYYVGDSVPEDDKLGLGLIDVRDQTHAALLGTLRQAGYRVELDTARPTYGVHSALTLLDFSTLRQTGRMRLGLALMLVDAQGTVLAESDITREFQLLREAPDEVGALGEGRFIEQRLQAFCEQLVIDGLRDLGLI